MPTRSQRHKTEIQGGGVVASTPIIGPWTAGSNTVTPVVISGGKARVERLGVDNPRISKEVRNLVAGKQYRVDTEHTVGTAIGAAYYRVDDTPGLWTHVFAEVLSSANEPLSMSFTAPSAGLVYIGVVQTATADGQFSETKDVFTLTRTN